MAGSRSSPCRATSSRSRLFSVIVGLFMMAVPPGVGRCSALPGAWVLLEAFRSSWPFGGVPLSLLATGQVSGPLAGLARVGGVS